MDMPSSFFIELNVVVGFIFHVRFLLPVFIVDEVQTKALVVYDLKFWLYERRDVLHVHIHKFDELGVDFFKVRLHYAIIACHLTKNVSSLELLRRCEEKQSHLILMLISVVPEVAVPLETCHLHPLDTLKGLYELLVLLLPQLKTVLLGQIG